MSDKEDEDFDRADSLGERRTRRSRNRGRSRESEANNTKQTTETTETDNSSQMNNTQTEAGLPSSQTNQTTETAQAKDDSDAVRNKRHVAMYLDEELADELDLYFDELSLRYKREHGEALQKNRDFYPAVVRSITEGEDIEDILELS